MSNKDTKEVGAISESDFEVIKGVGKALSRRLAGGGLSTLRDALDYIPSSYEETAVYDSEKALITGKRRRFKVTITGGVSHFGRNLAVNATLGEEKLSLRWFNIPFGMVKQLKNRLEKGSTHIISGAPYQKEDKWFIAHPAFIADAGDGSSLPPFVGIYPGIEGIGDRRLSEIISQAVSLALPEVVDFIPPRLLEKYGLSGLSEAYRNLHFPRPPDGYSLDDFLAPYRERLLFNAFFENQQKILARRGARAELKSPRIDISPEDALNRLSGILPFELTGEQRRAICEIASDMRSEKPMMRLLQGDVGCGKTAVALGAALIAADAGLQTAVMAPTEILADQHYRYFKGLLRNSLRIRKLTGKAETTGKALVMSEIKRGDAEIIIGTHSLLNPALKFKNLGLAIIDEQHRFGVLQRAALPAKGVMPNILIMSGTPIPRTLANALYGDLDISVIEGRLPHQKPIMTAVSSLKKLPDVYKAIRKRLESGGNIFYILPAIEESELLTLANVKEAVERLKKEFPGGIVAELHGKMSQVERDVAIGRFRAKEIRILVATTIVEVGMDIPNATMVVVENGERFGLAQLHQLRGRVGRGSEEGLCVVLYGDNLTDEAKARLKAFSQCKDGFELAEEDLRIRGAGELWGVRQSGWIKLPIPMELPTLAKIISKAKSIAKELCRLDPSNG
ncbi:MAG: ATP-dependent DNA helicase RecG [Myxococcota bacterium]